MVEIYFRYLPHTPSSQLMYVFNPNQLNQGDDVIINQWEWWSDDIPHDTLCLGTKFVTFRHQNWAICMFRSKRWAWFRLGICMVLIQVCKNWAQHLNPLIWYKIKSLLILRQLDFETFFFLKSLRIKS